MYKYSRLTSPLLITSWLLSAAVQGAATNGTCEGEPVLTTTDALGPFYVVNSSMTGAIAPAEFMMDILDVFTVHGKVLGNDCVPLANAQVEAWYAGEQDALGLFYSETNYRGRVVSDACGSFEFKQTFPALYPGRPIPHIHYRISAEDGTELLVTQLYFEGVIPERFNPDNTKIAKVVNEADGSRSAEFNIYVSMPGTVNTTDACLTMEAATMIPNGTTSPTLFSSSIGSMEASSSDSIAGEQCGANFCVAPQQCCQPSCGNCLDPGGICRQRACIPGQLPLPQPPQWDQLQNAINADAAAEESDPPAVTTSRTGELFN